MATRVTVSFVLDDYTGLDDTTVIAIGLTSRESALASSALSLLLDRNAWDEMSDSDWDSLSTTIADLLDEIIEAI